MGTLSADEMDKIRGLISHSDIGECIKVISSVEERITQSLLEFLENLKQIEYPPQAIDKNPDVQRKYKIAIDQQRSKNYPDAINTLQDAISINPSSPRLKEWLAVMYLKQNDISSAKRILQKEIPQTYTNFSKVWNLCYIYSIEKDFSSALKLLEASLETRAGNKKTNSLAISIALSVKDNDFLIRNLIQLDTFEAYTLGLFLSSQHNNQEGINLYKQKLLNEAQSEAYKTPSVQQRLSNQEAFDLCKHFINTTEIEDGIVHFKGRVQARSALPWVLYRILGDLYVENKQFDKAIEQYVYEFNNSRQNTKLHPSVISKRLLYLLNFCKDHKLWTKGVQLLRHADKFKINKSLQKQLKDEFESNIQNNENSKALKILLESMAPLQRINNIEAFIQDVDLVKSYCEALGSVYGKDALTTIDCVDKLVENFEKFNQTNDFNSKSDISHDVFAKYADFEVNVKLVELTELQQLITPLKKCMRSVVNDVGKQTHNIPNLNVKILNGFLPSEGHITSLIVELHNTSKFSVEKINVILKSLTGGFEIKDEDKQLTNGLLPNEKTIILFWGNARKVVPSETFAVQTTFSTSTLDDIVPESTPQFTIPVKRFDGEISNGELQNRYISVGSIPPTRPENFHGRDDVLRVIRASIAGGELREALFLSGLRRVGKTSVLQFILGNPPADTIPVLIRLDRYTPKTTGEFLLSILKEIEKNINAFDEIDYQSLLPISYVQAITELDAHPATVFSDVLSKISTSLRGKKLLLMFDEFQVVTEEISKNRTAKTVDKISIDALDIIRAHIEDRSFFVILTGSLLFDEIQSQIKGYDRLWGSIKVRDIAFIDQEAVKSVLQEPMLSQKVLYTDLSVKRVVEYTMGYPVFVQLIGAEVVNILNKERRLVVTPQDIDLSSKNIVSEQGHLFQLWWDEKRLEIPLDNLVIKYIIENQRAAGLGVEYLKLINDLGGNSFEIDHIDRRIKKLQQLHIIELREDGICRVNALMLEKWLAVHLRAVNVPSAGINNQDKPVVGIFVDYENVYFGVKNLRDAKTGDKDLLDKTETKSIAMKILDSATKYGEIREKWVVADWYGVEKIKEEEHQRIFRKYGWKTEIPQIKDMRKEKSDHALRDLVHEILDGRKLDICILVSGDGDFSQLVTYLIDHGKKVVIWGMKGKINNYYKDLEKWGKLDIGYVDDVLFGNI